MVNSSSVPRTKVRRSRLERVAVGMLVLVGLIAIIHPPTSDYGTGILFLIGLPPTVIVLIRHWLQERKL